MKTPVIPLIQSDDPAIAVRTAEALRAGGLTTLEVVWRTDAAMDCLEVIAKTVEGVTVGAGTVLSRAQAEIALKRGAQFIVSPGLDEGVVDLCLSGSIDIFAGVSTATEVQRAWNLGLRTVKFFPASLAGGAPKLKALSSVFRDMRFMPTGGVSAGNLAEFLAIPSVIACGGSWLTPKAEIEAGNFEALTTLAKDALAIAQTAKTHS